MMMATTGIILLLRCFFLHDQTMVGALMLAMQFMTHRPGSCLGVFCFANVAFPLAADQLGMVFKVSCVAAVVARDARARV